MAEVELLAPAGNFPNLIAAVEAGADAVFFGLDAFQMRALGKNFTPEDLPEIERICKTRSPLHKEVKRYLTLNTIVYDGEDDKLKELMNKAKPHIHAIICWDPAVIRLARELNIPFHISTQASIANSHSAQFYKDLGAQRVVLARECSLEKIKTIHTEVDIEIEAFCHGAMCISVSGRCHLSQFEHGKSANRGECLQPCRREYVLIKDDQGHELKVENNHVLSAKDLCTLPFMDKLKEAGITSFKIEGRNRDPRYVKTVVSMYRKALDHTLSEQEIKECMEQLHQVYNKGFSTGFYLGLPTADDLATLNHSAATLRKEFIGKVENVLDKQGVILSTITTAQELSVNDPIVVIGKTSGILETSVASLQEERKAIALAQKGQTIAIKPKEFPSGDNRIRSGDMIYKLVKNT